MEPKEDRKPISSLKYSRPLVLLALVIALAPVIVMNRSQIRSSIKQLPVIKESLGIKTIDDQIATYGTAARARLASVFNKRGVDYPPDHVTFIAIKDKDVLQVYGAGSDLQWTLIREYPILAASGKPGPKLAEGDGQVPEGIYSLNLEPNTPFHVGLRLNYPNSFDELHAHAEGRNPGGDILIHGSNCSIGCLAMGDAASEDLFVLAHDVKDHAPVVIIVPIDFRKTAGLYQYPGEPPWLPELYAELAAKLKAFPSDTQQ